MLEHECTLFRFNLGLTRRLLDGVEESNWNHQPMPGMNTPLWILGHLAISCDFALLSLKQTRVCPREWLDTFAPGTKPTDLNASIATKPQMIGILETGTEKLIAAVPNASEETLKRPNPVDFIRPMLPNLGDFLAHIMTTHAAMHLGQLSAWRRAMGLPSA